MKKVMYKNILLFMSDNDKQYLDKLLASHPTLSVDLSSVLETDDDGFIVFFKPSDKMTWSSVFFIQNLMIMQRMFVVDELRRQKKI
jgi:hypothetical protein